MTVSPRTLAFVAIAVAAWVAPGIAAPASRGGHVTADEPQYLLTALSLAEDHDLDLRDERAKARYQPFHRAELPRQEAVQPDGRAVSPHDPLLPLLLAVPMGVAGWVGAKLALALLAGALAAALVWVSVVRFGSPVRVALLAVGAFSGSLPLALYGTQVYPEVPAALAVTVAIGALTGPLGVRGIAASVAAVTALPWLSVKYAPVAAALAAIALVRLWRRGDRRAAVVAAAALAVGAATFAAAHLAWYGGLTPYASGAHFRGGELTVVGRDPNYPGRAIRLAGLLLDRDFGLAAWQPSYLLAVPAALALARVRPRHAVVLALPFAAAWVNATFVALTMHGWWFPGRQVVVVLPTVVLAIAWWAARRPGARAALAAGAVLGASVYVWLVVQALVGDLTTVVGFESLTHPLWRAWRMVLPDYRERAALDWARHGAWLIVFAMLMLGTLRRRAVTAPARLQGATTT